MTPSRIFFWALAAFIFGIATASFVSVPPVFSTALFMLGGAVLFYACLDVALRKPLIAAGLMLPLFAMGALRMAQTSAYGISQFRPGTRIVFDGEIAEEPVRSNYSQRLIIAADAHPERVMITARLYPEFYFGEKIRVSGLAEMPENYSPDFDWQGYLARQGIFRTMRYPGIERIEGGEKRSLAGFLFSARKKFSRAVNQALPEPHASFVAGLILGERRAIPPDIQDAMRKTSTSHLVALSGYNITIIADNMLRVFRFFWLPMAWSFAFASFGVVLFVIMTGASASVVRAAIMGILVLVARGQGRLPYARNILVLAAALMLAHRPDMLRFDLGFQLSFLATLGLVYGAGPLERALGRVRWGIKRFVERIGLSQRAHSRDRSPREAFSSFSRDTVITTLAAQLFVMPLLVFRFGIVSLAGPAANVAVVPAIPHTMLAGFIAGLAAFLAEFLSVIAGWPARLLSGYELGAIAIFSRLPGASVEVGPDGAIAVALLAVCLILLLCIRFRKDNEEFSQ